MQNFLEAIGSAVYSFVVDCTLLCLLICKQITICVFSIRLFICRSPKLWRATSSLFGFWGDKKDMIAVALFQHTKTNKIEWQRFPETKEDIDQCYESHVKFCELSESKPPSKERADADYYRTVIFDMRRKTKWKIVDNYDPDTKAPIVTFDPYDLFFHLTKLTKEKYLDQLKKEKEKKEMTKDKEIENDSVLEDKAVAEEVKKEEGTEKPEVFDTLAVRNTTENAKEDTKVKITIEIEGREPEQIELAPNEEYKIENVKMGTKYKVIETDSGGAKFTAFGWEDTEMMEGNEVSYKIDNDMSNTIVFLNVYPYEEKTSQDTAPEAQEPTQQQ